MAVIATRLSPKVEAGFSVVPDQKVRIVSLRNGSERRNADWSAPKRRYTSRYANFDRASRAEIMNCVMAAQGMTLAFLFKDWNDFDVADQSLGNAPAGTTAVQLVKTYAFGDQTVTRTINYPVASTVVVYQSGTPKAGTLSGGLFTPSSSWTEGQPLTADFEFDVPVRWNSDVEFVLPHREIAEVNGELIEVFGE